METPSRVYLTDLSVKLIELIHGVQNNTNYLLELLQEEFPEDKYVMNDLIEWNSLQAEIEDKEIQLETQGLCYRRSTSMLNPISDPP